MQLPLAFSCNPNSDKLIGKLPGGMAILIRCFSASSNLTTIQTSDTLVPYNEFRLPSSIHPVRFSIFSLLHRKASYIYVPFFPMVICTDDKVVVLESEKRAWESSPEAQAMREALNPWRKHDEEQKKQS
jgi:hypothetical protein